MQEGTSVGIITLDLKIMDNIRAQLEGIAQGANKSAQASFDRVGETMAQAMARPMENLDQAFKRPMARAKEQLQQTSEELDAIVARAVERMNYRPPSRENEVRTAPRTDAKLATDPTEFMENWDPVTLKLKEVQQEFINTASSTEQMSKAAETVKNAVNRSMDGVREKVRETNERAQSTIRRSMDRVSGCFQSMGDRAKETIANSTNRVQKSTGSVFDGIGKKAKKLGKSILSPFKAVFLTAGVYAAFRGLQSLMAAAGKQNKAFSNSLNAVKGNLTAAFTPILQAVMPMLTTLMNGLAAVTKSIAAFIAGVFGKTYAQSVEATKKLQGVQAQAGKAKGSLAGFDELTTIGESGKDAGGIDYGALETGGTAAAEGIGARFAESFQKIGNIFNDFVLTPIQNSLSKLGAPINKFKALFQDMGEQCKKWMTPLSEWFQTDLKDAVANSIDNVMTRVSALMDSFAMVGSTLWEYIKPVVDWFVYEGLPMFTEMWTELDNTFTKLCASIKKAVDTVWKGAVEPFFNFLSKVWLDICTTIKKLWDEYGATTFENIRTAIEKAQQVFQTVWENVLRPIFENIFAVLTALWAEHLQPLTEQIGEFVFKLINGATEIYNGFIAPLVEWFAVTLGPVIADVVNKIMDRIGKIVGIVSDVAKELFRILGGIIDFVAGVFTGDWEKAWNGISDVFKGIWNGMVGIVEDAANLIIDAVNAMIRAINSISVNVPDWDVFDELAGKTFGFNFSPLEHVSIPRLANGGVIVQPTLAMMGEYSGASGNPEIVSPQAIMRETFLESLVPLINAVEEMADRIENAINRKETDISLDGISLARELKPYQDREDDRVGKRLFAL